MKNNTNSILNKISEINSEIINLNRKIEMQQTFQTKLENSIKDEMIFRQNLEKKTFQINENILTKFNSFNQSFEESNSKISKKIDSMNEKIFSEIDKNREIAKDAKEGTLRRVENNEGEIRKLNMLIERGQAESDTKIKILEELFSREIKDIKKDIAENNIKIDILIKKHEENQISGSSQLTNILKELTTMKNEIEMLKNFKENTILNFKDISDEFLKNENSFNKLTNKINLQINEFESKLKLYDQSFNLQNESFLTVKKDVLNQLYDIHISLENKIRIVEEKVFDRLETNENISYSFRENLVIENDKFVAFISEKFEGYYQSLQKLLEYNNQDMNLITDKVKYLNKNFRQEIWKI
jgi:hypothetical protein